MRELKFRRWTGKIMENVGILDLDDKRSMDYYNWYDRYSGETISFDRAPIMQYTGLKDMNGKEIYEGDICQIHYYHDKTIPSPIGIVDWIDSAFSIRAVKNVDNTAITGIYSLRFKSGGHFGDTPAVEVIGNIYENHELLK